MSGGFFYYYDSGLSEQIEKLSQELHYAKNKYSPETLNELQNCINYIRLAQTYMHRVDWFLSGDDGEDSFHERLAKDLKELTTIPKVKLTIPTCNDCKHFKEKKCLYHYGDQDLTPYQDDATECYGFCPNSDYED
jgi:hypothetical protein